MANRSGTGVGSLKMLYKYLVLEAAGGCNKIINFLF